MQRASLCGLCCWLAVLLAPVPAQAAWQASVVQLQARQAWLELVGPAELAPGSRVELVYQADKLPMVLGEWEVVRQQGQRVLLRERRVAVPLTANMRVDIHPKAAAQAGPGRLQVRVLKNGQPTFGRLYVYRLPEDKLVKDLAIPPQGELTLELPPGEYRAAVLHTGLPNGPTVKLPPFRLALGGRVQKTAEFKEGWLEVEAISLGKAVPATFKVYRQDGYFLIQGQSKPPQPARFALEPGMYALEVIKPGQLYGSLSRAIMVRQGGTTKGRVTLDK
ncbi:MAG: hypothetical protein AB1814_08830 [Thermodesulfobacteriota bacterium]